MFQDIAGHKQQTEFLANSIKTGKLAHAYLFAGPDRIGKRLVAERFAQALLCEANSACSACPQCKTFIALSNADYIRVEDPEKIKIEDIRELIYKLSLKPYSAKYKTAVIDGADNITIEAANALLKSLEEAKPQTVIILISSNPHRLPKTILSRVQKINFGPVDQKDYEHLIHTKSGLRKKLIADFAAGKPGLAVSISQDEEFAATLAVMEENFGKFRKAPSVDRLQLAIELAGLETHEIGQNLEFWISRLDAELLETGSPKIAAVMSRLNQAKLYLSQNVNSKLLLFDLMLKTQT